MKRFLLLLLVCLFSVFVASAQTDEAGNPNDPLVNENANACFEGGTMAGKCNIDFDGNGTVDDFEVAWAWECGWYLIRYDAGMMSAAGFPLRCQSLLPAELTCYTSDFHYSILYTGNLNAPGNVYGYYNPNCGGDIGTTSANSLLIFADSFADALAICASYGTVVFLSPLNQIGYDSPDNVYGCTFK